MLHQPVTPLELAIFHPEPACSAPLPGRYLPCECLPLVTVQEPLYERDVVNGTNQAPTRGCGRRSASRARAGAAPEPDSRRRCAACSREQRLLRGGVERRGAVERSAQARGHSCSVCVCGSPGHRGLQKGAVRVVSQAGPRLQRTPSDSRPLAQLEADARSHCGPSDVCACVGMAKYVFPHGIRLFCVRTALAACSDTGLSSRALAWSRGDAGNTGPCRAPSCALSSGHVRSPLQGVQQPLGML
jgi:hypothetical protein